MHLQRHYNWQMTRMSVRKLLDTLNNILEEYATSWRIAMFNNEYTV
jgi:hypothetical protein